MELNKREVLAMIRMAQSNPDIPPIEIIQHIKNNKKIIIGIRPPLSEILNTVCLKHSVMLEVIKGKSRLAKYVRVRHQYFLIAIMFRYPQEQVGAEILRDHSTVLYGRNKSLNYCETEPRYFNEVMEIIKSFPNKEIELTQRLAELNPKITFNYEKEEEIQDFDNSEHPVYTQLR